MANWEKQLNNMTDNKAAAEIQPDALPFGYIVAKEPKRARRTFAMQQSLIDALQQIAKENGTNLNALVNNILTEYAKDYLKEDGTK